MAYQQDHRKRDRAVHHRGMWQGPSQWGTGALHEEGNSQDVFKEVLISAL